MEGKIYCIIHFLQKIIIQDEKCDQNDTQHANSSEGDIIFESMQKKDDIIEKGKLIEVMEKRCGQQEEGERITKKANARK